MKTNKNKTVNFVRGLFGIVAVGGLTFVGMSYYHLDQKLQAAARTSEATDRMVQIIFANNLIHQINDGQVENAKERLGTHLAENLAALDTLTPVADSITKDLTDTLVRQIARDKKLHPDYYADSTARVPANGPTKIAQATSTR